MISRTRHTYLNSQVVHYSIKLKVLCVTQFVLLHSTLLINKIISNTFLDSLRTLGAMKQNQKYTFFIQESYVGAKIHGNSNSDQDVDFDPVLHSWLKNRTSGPQKTETCKGNCTSHYEANRTAQNYKNALSDLIIPFQM